MKTIVGMISLFVLLIASVGIGIVFVCCIWEWAEENLGAPVFYGSVLVAAIAGFIWSVT